MRNKKIYVKYGRKVRKVNVKFIENYKKIGKFGRYNLYKKVEKKRKKQKKKINRYTEQVNINKIKKVQRKKSIKIRVSRKEKDFIDRIKGGVSAVDLTKEKEVEKKLLKSVQLLPRFDKYKFIGEINKDHKIISNGKVYGSFHALDNDKRDIYLDLINNLVEAKNEKFRDKLYALRKDLLKDGLVIEVDVYGTLHEKNIRKKYFGTLAIVGLMVEEAGFIESDLVGWSGENRAIEIYFDRIVKGLGGQKCYWIRNNLAVDTAHVTITDINLKLNYA